jgi:UDP-3-O-[3-hydroxymyristoyl] N-acetylglucosamine deacetylase/3-hydroxyacyl-[acyl-carrier-protein] dehydratase
MSSFKRASASISGSSLHTGEKVTLTVHPAPRRSWPKFKRSDLPDGPTIDADIAHVKTVERATTIVEGAVKVHTRSTCSRRSRDGRR